MALHPVANFVIARAIEKLDEDRLGAAIDEMGKAVSKCISMCRNVFILGSNSLQSNNVLDQFVQWLIEQQNSRVMNLILSRYSLG